jgi:hypothetical protein
MVYDMIDGTNVTIGIQKNGITCSTRSLCSTPLGKLSKHISSDIVKDCLEDVIKELYSSGKFGHYTFILSHYKRHMTLEKGECYATFVKTNELDIDPSIKIRRYEPVKISREDLLAFYEDEGKVSDKLDNPLGYIVRTQCNLGLAIEGSRHREARVIKYENLIKAPDADHKTIEQKIARLFLISDAKVAMYQKYPVYHYVFNEVLNEIFILVKHQNPIALLKQLHQIIHLNDFENAGLKELLNKLCAFSGIIKADDVELPEINEDLEKVANAVTLESLLKIFQKIFNDKFKYIGDLSVFGLLDISVFDGMSDDDIKLRLVSLVGTDILKSI